jgi:hypothetical protein
MAFDHHFHERLFSSLEILLHVASFCYVYSRRVEAELIEAAGSSQQQQSAGCGVLPLVVMALVA